MNITEGLRDKLKYNWAMPDAMESMVIDYINSILPKWQSIDNPPDYYKPVIVLYDDYRISTAWRANNGEEDIWTIWNTDNIIDNVSSWMYLPKREFEAKDCPFDNCPVMDKCLKKCELKHLEYLL